MMMAAQKRNVPLAAAGLSLIGLLAPACSDGGAAGDPSRTAPAQIARDSDTIQQNDDWIEPVFPHAGRTGVQTGCWSIVLRTYSGDQHMQRAAAALQQIRTMSPMLANARLERVGDGVVVAYGGYEDVADAAAQRDLKQIKAVQVGASKPFALAMLSYIEPANAPPDSPHDLRVLRMKHPKVDPLYTLQVAVWSDFESKQISRAEIRRRAEAYCAELRGRGFEAYVDHSDASGMSKVTVGAFDRTAFDPQSGLESPELTVLRRQFPAHLVNGEPVQEAIVPSNPKRYGYRTQQPKLVEVPK